MHYLFFPLSITTPGIKCSDVIISHEAIEGPADTDGQVGSFCLHSVSHAAGFRPVFSSLVLGQSHTSRTTNCSQVQANSLYSHLGYEASPAFSSVCRCPGKQFWIRGPPCSRMGTCTYAESVRAAKARFPPSAFFQKGISTVDPFDISAPDFSESAELGQLSTKQGVFVFPLADGATWGSWTGQGSDMGKPRPNRVCTVGAVNER